MMNRVLRLLSYLFIFLPIQIHAQQESIALAGSYPTPKDMIHMNLEELLSLEVIRSSSLMTSSIKEAPSTVSFITQDDIENSGARRLTDVLEIFVPNFQFLNQLGIPWQMGGRGIFSNDKQLLLVNGRNILQRTRNGICSELDLPGLSDIKHIEVIRGPGSAVHGPGGLGMVINIVTFDHMSFDRIKAEARVGGIESYQSAELAAAHSFGTDHGIFAYLNASSYQGANRDNAPLYMGRNDPFGEYSDKQNFKSRGLNYRLQAKEGAPQFKAHVQYNNKGFEIWARHMDGGERHNHPRNIKEKTGYTHTNTQASYQFNTSEQHSLKFIAGFDNFAMSAKYYPYPVGTAPVSLWHSREMEYNAEVFSEWKLDESFTVIAGLALRYDQLGLPYDGRTQVEWTPTLDSIIGAPWNTLTYWSTVELNYKPSDRIKLVLGQRHDKHTYTNDLYSPRGSIILMPNDKDVFKIIAAKSIRLAAGSELRIDNRWGRETSDLEELNSIEVSAAHDFAPTFNLSGNVFYYYWKPLGFNNDTDFRTFAGKVKSIGAEVEANYKTESIRLRASHSYLKLLEFNKTAASGRLYHYSTADNGIGNDFTYWHNHNTKISCSFVVNPKTTLTGSMNILWGSPGGYNFAKTAQDSTYAKGNAPENYTLNSDKPFSESIYLNLGAHFKLISELKIMFDAHNIAGLLNENWNKRWVWTVFQEPGIHVIQPASFSVSLVYRPNAKQPSSYSSTTRSIRNG